MKWISAIQIISLGFLLWSLIRLLRLHWQIKKQRLNFYDPVEVVKMRNVLINMELDKRQRQMSPRYFEQDFDQNQYQESLQRQFEIDQRWEGSKIKAELEKWLK